MNWKPDDVRTPVFHFIKICFVPAFFSCKFIRITGAEATENNLLTIWRDEFVAGDGDAGERGSCLCE